MTAAARRSDRPGSDRPFDARAGLGWGAPRRFKRTTTADPAASRPADLVNRRFAADRPDQLWVCDMTYIRTWVGFAYLVLVIDVFSRRIVGWALAGHLRTELPLEALELAIWTRHSDLTGLVQHTDAGSQYLAIRYGDTLAAAGALASVGTVGDSYDCETGICHQAA